MRPTALTIATGSLACGIVCAEYFAQAELWGWSALGVMALAVLLMPFFFRKERREGFRVLAVAFFVAFGIYLGWYASAQLNADAPETPAYVKGMIYEHPKVTEHSVRLVVRDFNSRQLIQVTLEKTDRSLGIRGGDLVEVAGIVKRIVNYEGVEFDYATYMKRQGVCWTMFVSDDRWKSFLQEDNVPMVMRLKRASLRASDKAVEVLENALDDADISALASAMLVGRREKLPQGVKNLYGEVGASHVLALSGLHLGLLIGLLNLFLRFAMARRCLRMGVVFVSLLFIWSYAFLAGCPTSLVRACLMSSVFFVACVRSGGQQSLHTLSFAAFVILLLSPFALFDVSFQLSFAAISGISLFYPRIRTLVKEGHFWGGVLWSPLAVSISASLFAMPLVAYYFHQVSLFGVLFSPIFVLFATLIIVSVLLAVVTRVALFACCASFLVWLQHGLMQFIASLPLSTVSGLRPSPYLLLMLYLALLASGYVWMKGYNILRRWYWPVFILGCLILAIIHDCLLKIG